METNVKDNVFRGLNSYLNYKRGHDIIVQNMYWQGYECDIVKFDDNGFVTEYEIKVSKPDFRKDFKKKKDGKYKHKELALGNLSSNKFYFVTPQDLLNKDEVPEYAGLIHVSPSGSTSIVKPAPFLHKRNDMNLEKYKELALKLSFRELNWRNKYEQLKIKNQYKIEEDS